MTDGRKTGTCDVCSLVDGDESPKDVGYCGMCKAWLCEHCRTSLGRRAIAALKKGVGKHEHTREDS